MITGEAIRLSFGQREVLRDAVLSVAQGEVVGLFGRNGTGKSCLFRILLGELPADYASIAVDGSHVNRSFRVPGLVNYMPQRPVQPPQLRMSKLLHLYGTTPALLCRQLPHFRELLDQDLRFGQLSGGNRRILELYLLLQMPTRFTFLDEPFAGLAPLLVERAITLIRSARDRKGLLISSHDYHTLLATTDRNYLLHHMRLQPFTSLRELRDLGYLSAS